MRSKTIWSDACSSVWSSKDVPEARPKILDLYNARREGMGQLSLNQMYLQDSEHPRRNHKGMF